MNDGHRNLSPLQFGLLGLFVLTFVAAIAAGIFRLPYSLGIKTILLNTLWGFFQFAVLKMTGHGPTRQVRWAVTSAVGSLIAFIPVYADILSMKAPIWLRVFNAALVIPLLLMHATIVTRTVRKALRPESEQA